MINLNFPVVKNRHFHKKQRFCVSPCGLLSASLGCAWRLFLIQILLWLGVKCDKGRCLGKFDILNSDSANRRMQGEMGKPEGWKHRKRTQRLKSLRMIELLNNTNLNCSHFYKALYSFANLTFTKCWETGGSRN